MSTARLAWLVVTLWLAAIMLGLLDVPVVGAIPRRALDALDRTAWIALHLNEELALPVKDQICAHPFCRRTDTVPKQVGGEHDGSKEYGGKAFSSMSYCPEHAPPAVLPRSARLFWWTACVLGTVLLVFVPLAVIGFVGTAARRRRWANDPNASDQERRDAQDRLTVRVLSVTAAVALLVAAIAWSAFAWW